jgi:nucleoside 2-deoxyribosyltransferase
MNMIIYIAGPMTGHENYNFDAFDKVRDYLKAAGHHPISPADIDRLYEGWKVYPPAGFVPTDDDRARFMRRDLNAIEGADAIYMMEGWENSKGARVELAYAEFLGKKIMYEIERMV